MVSIAVQISRLPDMSLAQLRERWKEVFQTDSPNLQNREFLIQRIAHQLQLRRYGGLDEKSQIRLKGYVDETTRRERGETRVSQPLPGTVLIRTYQNEEHRVLVLHKGFEYQQVQYRSLTEVAKAITGTHCSGPLFFGLVRKVEAKKGGRR
jgi:hypothetical protein